jgi:hypothetical protein
VPIGRRLSRIRSNNHSLKWATYRAGSLINKASGVTLIRVLSHFKRVKHDWGPR